MSKVSILGGFGSGALIARKAERTDCVPWALPQGDNTYVQFGTSEEQEAKTKPKVGTFYMVVRSLEKAASKKGTNLINFLRQTDLDSDFQTVILSTLRRTTR